MCLSKPALPIFEAFISLVVQHCRGTGRLLTRHRGAQAEAQTGAEQILCYVVRSAKDGVQLDQTDRVVGACLVCAFE